MQCRRYGRARGAVPPNVCLCSPFWFTQNSVFETLRNDKTTKNDGKRNNYIQTQFSFDVLPILLRNCWQSTAVNKRDAILRLINTRLRICREETCKPAESFPLLSEVDFEVAVSGATRVKGL